MRYPLLMPDREPEMQTTPKGTPIPTPTRGEFDPNLGRLLKAPKLHGFRDVATPGGLPQT